MSDDDKYREDSMEQAQIDAAHARGYAAGIERAAGVCDERIGKNNPNSRNTQAIIIAAAIRALLPTARQAAPEPEDRP